MNLSTLYSHIDEREEGQYLEGTNLDISADEIDELHKELSTMSKSDIPQKYRLDIQGLLESTLLLLEENNAELNTSLSNLLIELRGYE